MVERDDYSPSVDTKYCVEQEVVLHADVCIGVDCEEFSGWTYEIVLLSMFVIGVNRDSYSASTELFGVHVLTGVDKFWCRHS